MRAALNTCSQSLECSTSYCSSSSSTIGRLAAAAHRRCAAAAPLHRHRRRGSAVSATSAAAAAASTRAERVAEAKRRLLAAVEYTARGANTTPQLRGEVEEAQTALEALQPGEGLDYRLLEGAAPRCFI